jgi:hypothetical protein
VHFEIRIVFRGSIKFLISGLKFRVGWVNGNTTRPYLVFFSVLSVRSDYRNLLAYQEKTNKTLKSHNENEAKCTHPGHLVWSLDC